MRSSKLVARRSKRGYAAHEPARPHHRSRPRACRCNWRSRLLSLPRILHCADQNPHTRRAYARAATEFFDWLEATGVTQLAAIESVHVATYVEQLSRARSAPTAKLRLAALRHLFDWMVIGQIMPTNPAAAVRGPRHIVRRGKTPVLDPAEARQLDAIDTTTVIGLRDRALIGLMVYSFARTARRSACASRTCTHITVGYGCAFMRRAASSTPCRATTISNPICTGISTAQASRATRRRCCFRPTAALSAGSPETLDEVERMLI